MQTDIVPVKVFPGTASRFVLRAGNLGPPPSYYFQLQSVETVDGVETVTVLKDGNANMTDAQWQAWPSDLGTEGDDDYQLNCLTENLGLTRA